MEIQYIGHSCFRIKGKKNIIVTDPYAPYIGYKMPKVSADVVTVSHQHKDHNNVQGVTGTTRRKQPFIINAPGEYEISGLFVLGLSAFHDQSQGSQRGKNTVFVISLEKIRLVHLGDLGHKLSDKQLEVVNGADILMVPVGGVYTLGPKEAVTVVGQIQPRLVIPMHYLTKEYTPDFGLKATVDDFLNEIGMETKPVDKLVVTRESLPEEREVVVLKRKK